MKLILFLYLQDDEACVTRVLESGGVTAHSRLPLEGRGGGGGAGWYGTAAPYASAMAFALVTDDQATRLLQAVERCSGTADPRHPVHAIQLGVEATADSGTTGPDTQNQPIRSGRNPS
ncbi:MAG: hypothetical protein RQ751_12530 [Longimicrobiales bacterium]|nr:hypothetical protein [Longimicrobiales bacterium]